MKVYVVMGHTDYASDWLVAIYLDEKLATRRADDENLKERSRLTGYDVTVMPIEDAVVAD